MKKPTIKRALWDALAKETKTGKAVTIRAAGDRAAGVLGSAVSDAMLYKTRAEWIQHGNIKSVGVDPDTNAETFVAVKVPDQFVEVKWDVDAGDVQGLEASEARVVRPKNGKPAPAVRVGAIGHVVAILGVEAGSVLVALELDGVLVHAQLTAGDCLK